MGILFLTTDSMQEGSGATSVAFKKLFLKSTTCLSDLLTLVNFKKSLHGIFKHEKRTPKHFHNVYVCHLVAKSIFDNQSK